MKLFYSLSFVVVIALMTANPALADSNASGGGVINSQTFDFTGLTFDHVGNVGDPGNDTGTATFAGGFNATQVRLTGTLNAVNPATWGNEGEIQITAPAPPPLPPGSGETLLTSIPGPAAEYFPDPINYDFVTALTPTFSDAFAAGGDFELEFADNFDDAGVDAQSSNVSITFEEAVAISDSNGNFSLNSLNVGDSDSSIGEFALSNLFDTYAITLNEAGDLTFSTDEDPTGFTGTNADTEIAIFDAATGTLIAEDDDGGNGLFSSITQTLAAGDYILAVATFDTTFGDGPTVTAGAGTGDYSLTVSLSQTIPEPASAMLLGLACCGLALRRRK